MGEDEMRRARHRLVRRHCHCAICRRGSRDLLGHGSVQMSLRYAHLAPDQRREAVAKLNDKPILALTLRLQWQGPQPMCSIRLI
jgi:hypothetical protein